MRFNPPPLELPSELDWPLGAAFGPALPVPAGDPESIAKTALSFDLGPRIVARHGAAAIRSCLGTSAELLVRAHRRAVAAALIGEQTGRQVAELAARNGLEIIFLKGFALHLRARGAAGSRPFADLDVLLPQPHADELRDRLIADGWAPAAEAGNPQHLPPVKLRQGLAVDIHFRLRGVRVAAERWATAEELLAAGICRPADLGEGSWIPRDPLMAAHLAVHALEQHGHRPATYPPLRAVADIADLAAAAGSTDLAAEAAEMVGGSLDADEMPALFALGRILSAGRTPARDAGEADAGLLLRHIVAGAIDPLYRRGLAVDHTAARLREARRDGRLMRYIGRKLRAPGDAQAAVSGESADAPKPAGRSLWRPIRLGVQLAGAVAARLRRSFDR